jgi:hypothetical protein
VPLLLHMPRFSPRCIRLAALQYGWWGTAWCATARLNLWRLKLSCSGGQAALVSNKLEMCWSVHCPWLLLAGPEGVTLLLGIALARGLTVSVAELKHACCDYEAPAMAIVWYNWLGTAWCATARLSVWRLKLSCSGGQAALVSNKKEGCAVSLYIT